MPAQRIVGLVVLLLGYVSGAILVAQPFIPQIEAAALTLIFLFAACLLIGLPLYAAGENRSHALRYCGYGLLAIGLLALTGIFIDAVGIVGSGNTLMLWILAPAGLFLGLLLNYFAGALEDVRQQAGMPR